MPGIACVKGAWRCNEDGLADASGPFEPQPAPSKPRGTDASEPLRLPQAAAHQ